MTVSVTTTESATYTGNGSTTAFNTGFAFDADSWVKVYVYTTSTGARVLKELTTHYTLTGAGSGAAGTCTFLTAPATGTQVKMFKVPPLTQTQDYTNGSAFPNQSTEAALDKLTHIQQYQQSQLDRVLKVIGTESINSIELPTLDGAAGKALTVKSTEDGYEYTTISNSIPTQTGNSGKLLTTDGSSLAWQTEKTLATIAGTLPVASGGTGSTTAADARTALGVTAANILPSQGGNSGKYLTTDGSNSSWGTISTGGSWVLVSSGTLTITTTDWGILTLPTSYDEIRVIVREDTSLGSGPYMSTSSNGLVAQYSADSGGSYYSGTYDYLRVNSTGTSSMTCWSADASYAKELALLDILILDNNNTSRRTITKLLCVTKVTTDNTSASATGQVNDYTYIMNTSAGAGDYVNMDRIKLVAGKSPTANGYLKYTILGRSF